MSLKKILDFTHSCKRRLSIRVWFQCECCKGKILWDCNKCVLYAIVLKQLFLDNSTVLTLPYRLLSTDSWDCPLLWIRIWPKNTKLGEKLRFLECLRHKEISLCHVFCDYSSRMNFMKGINTGKPTQYESVEDSRDLRIPVQSEEAFEHGICFKCKVTTCDFVFLLQRIRQDLWSYSTVNYTLCFSSRNVKGSLRITCLLDNQKCWCKGKSKRKILRNHLQRWKYHYLFWQWDQFLSKNELLFRQNKYNF